jgi:hypothetical protein
MQRAGTLVAVLSIAFTNGCITSNQERHYDVRVRNASDQPITVELLGLDHGGSSKTRADLAPGGEYVGSMSGHGPGYMEARVRLRDDPDPQRFTIHEMPYGDLRREVAVEGGRIVVRKCAVDPTK